MNAAIICCGDSRLKTWTDRDMYDVVIGVNSAVLDHICDWWCIRDRRSYEMYQPDYPVKMFLHDEAVTSWPQKETIRQSDHLLYRDIDKHDVGGWSVWTKTTAMMLAEHLGATRIDLYGDDMRPGARTHHTHEQHCEDERRWERETKSMAAVLSFLHKQNVKVNRVNPVLEANPRGSV